MSAGPQARAAVAGTNAPTEKKSNAIVITNPNDSKPVNVHEPCTDLDAAANGNEVKTDFGFFLNALLFGVISFFLLLPS